MSDLVNRFRDVVARTIAADKEALEAPTRRAPWYDYAADPPAATWWWAVEHCGHPAFYLRALMAGDFAPGRRPDPRHVRPLARQGLEPVVCGTCGAAPDAADLVAIERQTGWRGALDAYRNGLVPWPDPTSDDKCWLCNDGPAYTSAPVIGGTHYVGTCARCARHLTRKA